MSPLPETAPTSPVFATGNRIRRDRDLVKPGVLALDSADRHGVRRGSKPCRQTSRTASVLRWLFHSVSPDGTFRQLRTWQSAAARSSLCDLRARLPALAARPLCFRSCKTNCLGRDDRERTRGHAARGARDGRLAGITENKRARKVSGLGGLLTAGGRAEFTSRRPGRARRRRRG
jgi:hypothetical protein